MRNTITIFTVKKEFEFEVTDEKLAAMIESCREAMTSPIEKKMGIWKYP